MPRSHRITGTTDANLVLALIVSHGQAIRRLIRLGSPVYSVTIRPDEVEVQGDAPAGAPIPPGAQKFPDRDIWTFDLLTAAGPCRRVLCGPKK